MKILKVLFIIVITVTITLSCTTAVDDTSSTPDNGIRLNETFDAFNTANWEISGSSTWAVSDISGNKVIGNTTASSFLFYKNYTGSIYTVSAKIKPVSATGICVGVISHLQNASNWYALTIDGGTPGSLVLRECISGTANGVQSVDYGTVSTAKWYTITFTVNGSLLTGKLTDGITTAELSYTDSSPFVSGKAGLLDFSTAGNFNSKFDDLIVTEF